MTPISPSFSTSCPWTRSFRLPGSVTGRSPLAGEAMTAVLCWIGVAGLVRRLHADASTFNRAKSVAIVGLTVGVLLWHVGFMVIGGEWFGMWESQHWNGVPSAFRFLMTCIAVLIFVAIPDQELDRKEA